jgi:hypothetical protein
VLGGDAGGGLLAEAYVVPEADQVLMAAFGLQFRCSAPGLGQML